MYGWHENTFGRISDDLYTSFEQLDALLAEESEKLRSTRGGSCLENTLILLSNFVF